MACPFCGQEQWHGWDERVALEHVIGSGTVETSAGQRPRDRPSACGLACVREPDRAEAKLELALHLGPEHGRFRTVRFDEVPGQVRGGVLEQRRAKCVEAIDELCDQRTR